MTRDRLVGAALVVAAPIAAIALAAFVAGIVLAATGADPFEVARRTLEYGTSGKSAIAVVNRAIPYYLAGIAAAIAFRAQLFNIGIDGQYRLAAFAAAAVGGAVDLPAPLHLALIVGVAMLVGAGWAAIAGLLAAYRGVSVVIGTIMLNAIATGIIAWLLGPGRLGVRPPGSNNLTTTPIAESGWLPAIPARPSVTSMRSIVVAALVGAGYWLLLGRTRFGFDLRAIGSSLRAARVSSGGCPPDDRGHDAPVGCGGGPRGHAPAAELLHESASTSPRAWAGRASRSRSWAATTRWASRSGRCCGRGWSARRRSST